MALSEVQNFANIIGNNAFGVVGKIKHGVNMFETTACNYTQDNRYTDYDPWSYDLFSNNSNKRVNMEEDDSQDLNNSMMYDLVAKILEDDPVVENDYINHYNGNASETISNKNVRGCSYPLAGNNGTHVQYQPKKLHMNDISNVSEHDRDYNNLPNELNMLKLDLRMGQMLQNGSMYSYNNTGLLSQQSHRAEQQQQQQQTVANSNGLSSSSSKNYLPVSNGLLTTTSNGLHYEQPPPPQQQQQQQLNSWSDSGILGSEYPKDLFGKYQRVPTPSSACNPDFNFNMALNLVLDSSDNLVDVRGNLAGQNIPPNPHSNPILNNLHESFNGQTYGSPTPTLTDFNSDPGILLNSPLPHFSPADSALQTFFGPNFPRNNYDEYKDLKETALLNMTNVGMSTDQLQYLQQQQQQQQQQACKLEKAGKQSYKTLMNRYNGVNEYHLHQVADLNVKENSPAIFNGQQLKMLNSPKAKSAAKEPTSQQMYSPIGFPRNLSSRSMEPPAKYNYQAAPPGNCYQQRYTASNGDNVKILSQNSMTYANGLKRPGYKLDPYEVSNEIGFPGNSAHLNHPITGGSPLDNEILSHLMKRQQQQQQQQQVSVPGLQNVAGMPSAEVLFGSGLIQGTNAAGGAVFPSVMPVPVPVPVPTVYPMSMLFGMSSGLRNGNNSIRRLAPSSVLYLRLEQTYEQFKQLEKERKKCEAGLAAHFPGKRVTSANNLPIPRLQGNPSRVDRVVIDHFREHARVITLIAKMERLRGAGMSLRVHKAMQYWLETIKLVQERRKQELCHAAKRQKENIHCIPIQDDKDILALAASIHELTKASRFARTGMYNAMQATILYNKDVEKQVTETSKDVALMLKQEESQQPSTTTATGAISFPSHT